MPSPDNTHEPTSHPRAPLLGAVPPWRVGLHAAWVNRWAGLGIFMIALAVLLGYEFVPAVHDALTWLTGLRERTGWLFGVLSTAAFGGLIPWLVLRSRVGNRPPAQARDLLFVTLFWGYKGLEIALLYHLLAVLLGDTASVGVVVGKVVLDQLVYCPIWAVPSTVWPYRWQALGFDTARAWRELADGPVRWYRHRVLPVLIANLMVWVPAVAVIYVLPLPLQLPVQNLVLCFWSLMLVLQVKAR